MKMVLASHGDLCSGLLNSYEMIAGVNEDILAVSLNDLGIEDFKTRLISLLDSLIIQEEVLVVTDIKGGTPFNESYMYALMHSDKVRVISGMNLPMVIEVGLGLNSFASVNDAANMAVEVGRGSIENMTL